MHQHRPAAGAPTQLPRWPLRGVHARLARGIAALNLRVIVTIFVSWLITLPAGAGLAIMFFFIFKATFT